MGGNLHAASSQWASRPADERFWNISDMTAACRTARLGSTVKKVPFASLQAHAVEGNLLLSGPQKDSKAHLTNYAFGQLATSVGAPAGYLRSLPAHIAAEALNVGIANASDKSDRNLLFHANGRLTLRAALSDDYTRVWDDEVCAYVARLIDDGWRTPAGRTPPGYTGEQRAATEDDILPGQINISVGSQIAPSGLYASDHDMFAFLVAPDRIIDGGTGHPLMRGVFIKNSEVGDSSLQLTFFLMQTVCGNHIVWNASNVHEIRVRHTGHSVFYKARRAFEGQLTAYRDAADVESKMIASARNLILGEKKEDVLEAVFKYAKGHSLPISRARLDAAYDAAEKHVDWYGSPRSLWGVVSGLTHTSQGGGFADDRANADKAAAGLLKMVAGF